VKVYTNQNEGTRYLNGEKRDTKYGRNVFSFTVPLADQANIRVTSAECSDEAEFRRVSEPNPTYKLGKSGDNGANWTK
jgi:hypothetical protein